jgi:hypothetical protein
MIMMPRTMILMALRLLQLFHGHGGRHGFGWRKKTKNKMKRLRLFFGWNFLSSDARLPAISFHSAAHGCLIRE